jgi:NitT/TauT family transport system permease protein
MKSAFSVRGKLTPKQDAVIGLTAIAVVFVAWLLVTREYAPDKRLVEGLFLPSPGDIVGGMRDLFKNGELPASIWVSLWRIAQAMFYTVVVGVPIGILMGSIPFVDAMLRKFLDGFKSVPPTAFIGLIILWFGIEEKSKVVFLFLGAIFYMTLMVKNAVRNVPQEYVTVATDIGASSWQLVSRVLLPGALPQIWDAIIVCNGLMWTYIVLAEWVNADSGLGHMISIASRLNRSDEVFAGVIVIAVISAATDWLLRTVRGRLLNW